MSKKLLSVLFLGVFVFTLIMPSGRALAQNDNSIEGLQKQVSQLLEMIKNLQAQIEALRNQTQPVAPMTPISPPTPTIPGSESLTGLLQKNSEGIVTIQQWGNHTIATNNGTYAVKAVNDNVLGLLNQYNGQRVTLWGQLKYQNLEGGFWGFTAKKVYPEGYGCSIPAKVKIGYKGDDVKTVQEYLATDKTIYPEGLVTGYYGNLTKKALEKFQEKKGLTKTGEFDEDTREELEIEIESQEKIRCVPQPLPTPTPIPNQGFKVYSPSAGENWQLGQTYKIAWSQIWPTLTQYGCSKQENGVTVCVDPAPGVGNTSFAPIGAVQITLHRYISCLYPEKPTEPRCLMAEAMPYVISAKTDNDGVFEWTVPADLAAQYQGKVIVTVAALDGGFTLPNFDSQNLGGLSGRSGVFTIGGTVIPPTNQVKVISPAYGDAWFRGTDQKIAWSYPNLVEMGPVTISVNKYQDCYGSIACPAIAYAPYMIASGVENTGRFVWSIPKDLATNYQGKMRIKVRGASGVYGQSEAFSILPGIGGNNLPPVVSGVSGPTALKVGETGTWTVKAYDPEGGSLSYSIVWGDEGASTVASPGVTKEMLVQNTATFTHTYYGAGTYTPVFYVTDDRGQQARTSMSVVVGGGTITISSYSFYLWDRMISEVQEGIDFTTTILNTPTLPVSADVLPAVLKKPYDTAVLFKKSLSNNPSFSASADQAISLAYQTQQLQTQGNLPSVINILGQLKTLLTAMKLVPPTKPPAPIITSISSASAKIGDQMVINGSGFINATYESGSVSGVNVSIFFGNGSYFRNILVNSPDGKSLVFTVPETIRQYSTFKDVSLFPGEYNILVGTEGGKSNMVSLTVVSSAANN